MNIVFDFAGVLFTWQPHALVARLLPQHAPSEDAAHALVADFFQGYGGDWSAFDRGTIASAPLAAQIAQRTGLAPADVRRVIDAVPIELVPIAPSVALLRRLRALGHRLFFLSNMPAPYADHLDASHDFISLFDAGIYSGRVGMIKPERAIFDHALDTFGIAAGETVFIDDVAHNVDAARAAGWRAIQFVDARDCEAELARLGALPGARA